jgi:UDP-glucose 4-epimerase
MSNVLVIGGKGYIGSALSIYLAAAGCTARSWDTCWFGDHTPIDNIAADYGAIPADFLSGWDSIVVAAGHSGVDMCSDRPAAFANNVASFTRLVDALAGQRLIFMSSSSLYSGTAGEATEDFTLGRPENCYDQTMYERDLYATASGKDCYGLRLGTVCGASPNLRSDLMLNKMYLDARDTGVMVVANPECSRPILAMADLCRAVHRIVQWPERIPGIYNVASFNGTIGDIAAEAARFVGAILEPAPALPTYDMRISTEKFRRCFDFTFEGTVASILRELASGRPGNIDRRGARAERITGDR